MVDPSTPSSGASSGSAASAFPAPRAAVPNRQAIALLSLQADPAIDLSPDEVSGQSVYVRRVGETLARLGWQVDLVTRKTHPEDAAIVEHSPHCRTVRLKAGPEQYLPQEAVLEHIPEFLEQFSTFQIKKGGNSPLVHTNDWISGWIGLQLKEQNGLQVVHTYHTIGAMIYQATGYRPAIAETRLAMELRLMERANCVVATSPQQADQLKTLVSADGNIAIIPCGTDIETFHDIPKSEARAKLGLVPQEKVLLFVGRLASHKGLETLVHAFSQLKSGLSPEQADQNGSQPHHGLSDQKLRLLIVGSDDPQYGDQHEQERISHLVRDMELDHEITFVGAVNQRELPFYYTASDVCVIPSHYEPFGMVALEAMACGTPVVATDVGGLKFTVVPEETGLLVPPKDDRALAEAIARVLTDADWTQRLTQQATSRVQQNFSWAGVAAQLSDLYRRILAELLM
jgi:glycosyltransferase involved in cell wall biosynthesis